MKLLPIFFALFFLLVFPQHIFAVENPLAVPNNKVGIHILFPEEIDQAATLINTNGGDWGYVTIPIQAGDKNLLKWQFFMDRAKTLHVIPIIRLATEGDYFNTKVWRKPTGEDILDFANFLSSLNWPTKNKYVVIFNEVNRGDEWGGSPNPFEYANILEYTGIVFKNKDTDFFVISAGLDNAAPTTLGIYINSITFVDQMFVFSKTVFNNVDGVASHSYPNPGFRQPPSINGKQGTASFIFEKEYIKQISGKDLPVFITETGWNTNTISQEQAATYYKEAFTTIWSNSEIVAVTPFLLRADLGPFQGFSFMRNNHETVMYQAIKDLVKIKGMPTVLPLPTLEEKNAQEQSVLGVKDFTGNNKNQFGLITLPKPIIILGKWLLKIE